jgi:hypothetical protein
MPTYGCGVRRCGSGFNPTGGYRRHECRPTGAVSAGVGRVSTRREAIVGMNADLRARCSLVWVGFQPDGCCRHACRPTGAVFAGVGRVSTRRVLSARMPTYGRGVRRRGSGFNPTEAVGMNADLRVRCPPVWVGFQPDGCCRRHECRPTGAVPAGVGRVSTRREAVVGMHADLRVRCPPAWVGFQPDGRLSSA